MGGTFMSMPEDYRGKFIAQLHNALSGFTGTDVDEAVRCVFCILFPHFLILIGPLLPTGILNKVNQKRLALRSRQDQIIVCVPI